MRKSRARPRSGLRRKTAFWADKHFWAGLSYALLLVLIRHLPDEWKPLAEDIYAALVFTGVIAARRHNETDLGLSTGISSTQFGTEKRETDEA